MSEVYSTESAEAREAAMEAAALAIRAGDLVIIPTDTVYGVACDAFDEDAVSSLREAKEVPRAQPAAVLVSTATTLDALANDLPAFARALVEEFWPGPLTLVCKQQPSLQWDLGDTRGTVAVRMPDHDLTREILDRTGPLAVSSVNLPGMRAATDGAEAEEMLGELVGVTVDDGPSPGGQVSTVVDATSGLGRVLRRGAISLEQLNAVLEPLGVTLTDDDGDDDGAPAADDEPVPDEVADLIEPEPVLKAPGKKAPAKKAPAKKAPAKKTPAKKTPAKKTPAKKAPATAAAEVPDPPVVLDQALPFDDEDTTGA